ncbi:MAG TPA: UDP-N-acetylmuramoyl-tripeptide--D-alanyl-D-alanine ligase, partial [Porphyromonadaceae bacterium]|nr:UDP-N-acetylmuramoyl-tripeptide--D-alanyl-D-alanine ligase [Porphyromonadaceae bacterium]
DGKVFVNKDNAYLLEMSDGMNRILYGKNDPSLFASGAMNQANPFLEFNWNFFDQSYLVKTKLVGEYNLDNALAAVAVGKFFGINTELISEALQEYEPKNNRSQFERTERNDLIVDAYNANPTSMRVSLDFFNGIPSSLPKAVILGEMKELGESSEKEHSDLMDLIDNPSLDKIYLVGEVFNRYKNDGKAPHIYGFFNTVEELMEELQNRPLTGHYILLKGSHSVHLEKVIPYL